MARLELEKLVKAPFATEHESLLEAILADLADMVPVVGEVAGVVRVLETLEKRDDMRLALELGDLLAGFPPVIGDILDALTPTNTLLYLLRKK